MLRISRHCPRGRADCGRLAWRCWSPPAPGTRRRPGGLGGVGGVGGGDVGHARQSAGLRRQCRRPRLLRHRFDRPHRRRRAPRSTGRRCGSTRYRRYTFTIEGHADERGTREYNIALGARRAADGARLPDLARRRRQPHADDLLRQGAAGGGLQRHLLLVAEPARGDGAQQRRHVAARPCRSSSSQRRAAAARGCPSGFRVPNFGRTALFMLGNE